MAMTQTQLIGAGHPAATSTLKVTAEAVAIEQFLTTDPDVVRYLYDTDEPYRLGAFGQMLRVGAVCLEKAQQSADLDFVKLRLEQMLREVEGRLAALPASIAEQLGTDEGKALHPVKLAVAEAQKAVQKDLGDVRGMIEDDLDPQNPASALGAALAKVRNLLDPERTDSLPFKLAAELALVSAADGQLAGMVKKVLAESLEQANKPMREAVEKLQEQLKVDARVQEIVAGTPLKGAAFEDLLLEELKAASIPLGGHVEHTGGDNQPGDFVIEFGKGALLGSSFRLVVEAKDDQTAKGRAKLKTLMEEAMSHRKAQAGLFIGKTPAALAKEIGEIGEGACASGPFVAATVSHLSFALRLVAVLVRIAAMQKEEKFDKVAVQAQVLSIRDAMKKFASMRTVVSGIDKGTAGLREQFDEMESGLKAALLSIELALSLPEASA